MRVSFRSSLTLICLGIVVGLAACSKATSPTAPSTTTQTPAIGQSACTYSISIPSDERSKSVDAAGAVFTVSVATAAECPWSVTSTADFVSATLPELPRGNGSVQIVVAPNAGSVRTAQLSISGQVVEITQQGATASPTPECLLVVTPERIVGRARGETVQIDVNATAPNCPWSAESSADFLRVLSGGSGEGSGQVSVEIAPNPGRERTGSLSVGRKLVTIVQDATVACADDVSVSVQQFAATGGTGTVTVTAPAVCDWKAATDDAFIVLDAGHSGSGDGTIAFTVRENTVAATRRGVISVADRSVELSQSPAGTATPIPTPPPPPPAPEPPPLPTPPPPPVPSPLPRTSNISESLFAFESHGMDFVGLGQSQRYTPTTAVFLASTDSSNRGLYVVVSPMPSLTWSIKLEAPQGSSLRPGTYEGAARAQFQGPSAPGLSVSGDGRGCNAVTGRFVVYEADFGAGNSIQRFHAAFEQHCEGESAALVGEIAVITPAAALPAPTANPTSSLFRVMSEPGDLVGNGRTLSYSNTTANFTIRPQSGNEVQVWAYPLPTPSIPWTLAIVAPNGAKLTPGRYDGAVRWTYLPGPAPGISVVGDGFACNELSGAFQVHEVVFGADGTLQRLQVTFEQHCENRSPALRGEVVYIKPAMP